MCLQFAIPVRLYFCILFQILTISAASQTNAKAPKYSIRHFTSENGLPQNSVRAITQDADGFVWLATEVGLVRFDGQTFLTFGKSDLRLQTTMFMSFLPDMEGRKDRFYALTDGFEYIKIASGRATNEKPQGAARLRKMFRTPESKNGLLFSMGLPNRFQGDWAPTHQPFWLPEGNGSFLMWQKDGKIDLYSTWKKRKSYKTRITSPRGFFRLGRNLYHDDEAGNIELLVAKQGTAPGKIRLGPGKGPVPDLSENYLVYSHDLSGQAFIYQNKKLYLLSEGTPGDIRTMLLLDDFDFERNNVSTVFFDQSQQRLFLGTLSNGLFILDFQVFETLTINSNESQANVYYSQAAFSDTTVITPSFKVLGKDRNGQIIAQQLPLPTKMAMNRYSMLKARSGDLWFFENGWLYRLDGNARNLKGQWDAGGEISQLYEDPLGRIWLGMKSEGLKYFDPRENTAQLRTFTREITDISYMLQQGKDLFWVATAAGLVKVNLTRKTISLVPHTEKFYVKNIFLSKHGELWFTTFENGFFLLQNDKLTRFPVDGSRYLANGHCLVEDANGFFWLPTNHGLFRIYHKDLLDFTVHGDSTRLYYHRYSKQHGFRINEFNGGCQPCALRLQSGYISLPSLDGLVFFKPEQIPVDVPDSKIFIDRIEANSKEIPVSGSKIELADISDIQVFVSSPYLGPRENQQLYYNVSSDRRDETTQIWHPIENDQQSIHLNNLESGTYTLKVRKNAGFGPNSERLATLTIVIPNPWYETWPFKAFVVILVLAATYLYFKNRLKKADNLNKILESRVQERTLNLQDTLGVLKTSEQELLRQTRLQMHLIASISHDIRSPLRSIEFTSGKLSNLIQNGEYTLAETVGTSVNESSKRILTLLENMLSYVRSQFSDSSVVYETFAARSLVDEVAFIFKQAFAGQQNQFENHVPETLQLRSNRQLLKIILHNLIDNANKFTSAGKVAVSAGMRREAITLVVSDTGPGLSGEILNWFNESDAVHPESPDGEPGIHGIGLIIVKELAEILKVEIKADAMAGTRFSITFSERD